MAHSPGAPFLMFIQRLASLMAGGNVRNVAVGINAWSAIASGLTIALLFWTITAFAKKMLLRTADSSEAENAPEPDRQQIILLLSAGFIGALAYTFSDNFWYSSVEAEVYATSSLLTALVFRAMLQWDAPATRVGADRWLYSYPAYRHLHGGAPALSAWYPEAAHPYDVSGAFLASDYYKAGGIRQAAGLAKKVVDNAAAGMEYLATLRNPDDQWLMHEIPQNIGMMKIVAESAIRAGDANTTAYAIQAIEETKSRGILQIEALSQLLEMLRTMQQTK